MPRGTERLTALQVTRALGKPGTYADGGGLYLQVTEGGASWLYRFMLNGRAREMGLGPFALYGLREARAKALDARRLRHDGVDPIDARRDSRVKARLEAAKAMTFKECADAFVSAHRAGWQNAKHAAQWEATLKTYVEPIIGRLPVQVVDTALVMKVLDQKISDAPDVSAKTLWLARPETASRVRGRIEAVLNWAKTHEYRQGENPARWRGHLENLLPARSKVRVVEHHAALPYDDLPEFMSTLRVQEGIAARALEFAILTAGRTSEVIDARWKELDLPNKTWTVPAKRMKARKEHCVPLNSYALEVLKAVIPLKQADNSADGFVFPGAKPGHALSNMSFLMLLRRMGHADLTAHGFRSSFRDWAAERTNFPNEVAEMALAHKVSNKVEAAYRRGNLFEKRRRLMMEWSKFCTESKGSDRQKVVPIHAVAAV